MKLIVASPHEEKKRKKKKNQKFSRSWREFIGVWGLWGSENGGIYYFGVRVGKKILARAVCEGVFGFSFFVSSLFFLFIIIQARDEGCDLLWRKHLCFQT